MCFRYFSSFVFFRCFFFFKQKTAYELRISDWSSDVCSSDLLTDTFTDGLHIAQETPFSLFKSANEASAGRRVFQTVEPRIEFRQWLYRVHGDRKSVV